MNTKKFIKFKSNIFHEIKYLNDYWNSNTIFDETPLILAAFDDYTAIVEILLSEKGIDINCKDI